MRAFTLNKKKMNRSSLKNYDTLYKTFFVSAILAVLITRHHACVLCRQSFFFSDEIYPMEFMCSTCAQLVSSAFFIKINYRYTKTMSMNGIL